MTVKEWLTLFVLGVPLNQAEVPLKERVFKYAGKEYVSERLLNLFDESEEYWEMVRWIGHAHIGESKHFGTKRTRCTRIR